MIPPTERKQNFYCTGGRIDVIFESILMNHILEVILTFLKNLIFEEEPSKNETPMESLQRKMSNARNNIGAEKIAYALFYLLSAIMFLIFIYRVLFTTETENVGSTLLLAVLFFIAGFMMNRLASETRSRLNDMELAYDIEQFEINKEVSYAEKTLRLHNVQLEKYYSENLNQSKWIFFVGLFCITAGLGIVVATCYFVNTSATSETSKIIISVLGGLSALLTDFVAVIYLRMNSEISSTLRDFHSRLVDTHKILMGNLIAAKIDDKELKHQTLSEIAKEVCGKVNVTR